MLGKMKFDEERLLSLGFIWNFLRDYMFLTIKDNGVTVGAIFVDIDGTITGDGKTDMVKEKLKELNIFA